MCFCLNYPLGDSLSAGTELIITPVDFNIQIFFCNKPFSPNNKPIKMSCLAWTRGSPEPHLPTSPSPPAPMPLFPRVLRDA